MVDPAKEIIYPIWPGNALGPLGYLVWPAATATWTCIARGMDRWKDSWMEIVC